MFVAPRDNQNPSPVGATLTRFLRYVAPPELAALVGTFYKHVVPTALLQYLRLCNLSCAPVW